MNEPNQNSSDETKTKAPESNPVSHPEIHHKQTEEFNLPLDLPQQDFFVAPTVIEGYHIIGVIARGGMGVVLEARELLLNREVAIKILLPKAQANRFILESKITAQLPHPNIPPVHTLGTLPDRSPYLVMKLIRGKTLSDELKARKDTKENLSHWVGVFEQICQAVGFAHSNKIIHRDLKPSNIMVGQYGEVQVMDWGLAKDLKSQEPELPFEERVGLCADDLTITGAVMGTPSYMAPEQARGEAVSPQTDVFALGGVLAAILTGKGAYFGTTVQEIIDQAASGDVTEVLQRLGGCGADTELISIASRCLSPDANGRPVDAQVVANLVREYRDGVEARLRKTEANRAADLVKYAEQAKRRKVLQFAGVVILAVSIIGIGFSSFFAWRASERAQQESIAKKNAEEKKIEADKANEQSEIDRLEAKKQEGIAKTNELEAMKQLDRIELLGYASKLSLAQSAFAEGNLEEASRHLEECCWNLRGWEYHHLWTRFKGKQTLLGHRNGVNSVVFSPDGKRILSGSNDKTLKLWDAEKGQELLTFKGHTGFVTSVAFSPDSKRILSGSEDNTLKVWDAENGQEILTLKGHTSGVSCVSWSPDGNRIASGGGEFGKFGEVKIWDAENGQEILTLKKHTNSVSSVSWSPDGKCILAGSGDNTAKVWNAENGREILTLKGHTKSVKSVTWSPDGKRILTGSWDNTVKVWDAEKGTELLTLKGHTKFVNSVAFSPDGKRILSGSGDRTAKVWDAEKGIELLILRGHTSDLFCVSWSPDGKRILTGSWDNKVKVWDAEKGTELLTLKGHTQSVLSLSWSRDGKRIVSGSRDKTLKIWDVEKAQENLTLKGHTRGVSCVAFSPDGKRVFGWDAQNKVLAWDTKTGQPTSADNPPPKSATSSNSAISPDGRLAAKVDGLNISLIDLLKPPPPDKSNEWPLPDAAERKRYHTEQTKLAEDAKQYFAQAFHLGRLLLDDPENKDLKAKREEALKKHEESFKALTPKK